MYKDESFGVNMDINRPDGSDYFGVIALGIIGVAYSAASS